MRSFQAGRRFQADPSGRLLLGNVNGDVTVIQCEKCYGLQIHGSRELQDKASSEASSHVSGAAFRNT